MGGRVLTGLELREAEVARELCTCSAEFSRNSIHMNRQYRCGTGLRASTFGGRCCRSRAHHSLELEFTASAGSVSPAQADRTRSGAPKENRSKRIHSARVRENSTRTTKTRHAQQAMRPYLRERCSQPPPRRGRARSRPANLNPLFRSNVQLSTRVELCRLCLLTRASVKPRSSHNVSSPARRPASDHPPLCARRERCPWVICMHECPAAYHDPWPPGLRADPRRPCTRRLEVRATALTRHKGDNIVCRYSSM